MTAVLRSTQPSALCGTVKWASAYGLSNNNNGDGGCGWFQTESSFYTSKEVYETSHNRQWLILDIIRQDICNLTCNITTTAGVGLAYCSIRIILTTRCREKPDVSQPGCSANHWPNEHIRPACQFWEWNQRKLLVVMDQRPLTDRKKTTFRSVLPTLKIRRRSVP